MREQAEKLQIVERKLSASKGQFELFALFLREGSPDKWDLLISSDWARDNKRSSLNVIIKELQSVLSEQEQMMLSRIIILDKDDVALKTLHDVMPVKHGLVELMGGNFFGLDMKQAYLITS